MTRRRLIGIAASAIGALALRARAAAPPAALGAATPGFEERAHALWTAIHGAGWKTVQDWRGSPLYGDPAARETAAMLVSAFYLGVVGDGDAATLVSYEAALMFAPTQDVTPIPSYALGGPGYWGLPG
jgi:hypothetical protein